MSLRPSFRTRALVYAALTANAIRPLPGFRAGVPSFFAGWITGELAPHWLAVTTADAAAHLTAKRRDPVGTGARRRRRRRAGLPDQPGPA